MSRTGSHEQASLKREVENLENVIFVCFGCPSESELPQVGNEEEMIIDLLQHLSGRPHNQLEGEIHHQFDTYN